MNFLDERQNWALEFKNKESYPVLLGLYKELRESKTWRSTIGIECLCEYALYLEDKLND